MADRKGYPWSGVFCLEGAWEDDLTDRSSVLPMLELLERLGRIDFVHRDVGTRAELEHYLRRWISEGLDYHVLYLSFHSRRGGLWLSYSEDGVVGLDQLATWLEGELTNRVVLLGSCSLLQADRRQLRCFLKSSGARAVVGYTTDMLWVDSAAMDLLILGVLASYKRLGTALKRLESATEYGSLRDALGLEVVRA